MTLPQIGRFQIAGELPTTGGGRAFHATDTGLGGQVFLKLYPWGSPGDSVRRSHLEQELAVLGQLSLPGLVPVLVVGEQDGFLYLAYPFLPGGSLEERLADGPLEPDNAARILSGVAPTLDGLHTAGILHRNLKPTNLLFDEQERPYLTGLGTQNLAGDGVTARTLRFNGNERYLSPEQAWGAVDLDWRSDLYMLGGLLFHMLTGSPPFSGDTPVAVATRHLTIPVPRLRDLPVDLPAACQPVIDRALAKSPEDRFRSARKMAEGFRASLEGREVAITSEGPEDVPLGFQSPSKPPGPNGIKAGLGIARRSHGWILASLIMLAIMLGSGLAISGRAGFGPLAMLATAYPTRTPTVTPLPTAAARVVASSTAAIQQNQDGQSLVVEMSPTPGVEPTATRTPEATPLVLGAADKIAFLRQNDIYTANLDGTDIQRLTDDEIPKSDLNWTPDGQALTYFSEGQVRILWVESGQQQTYGAFEEFEISPDMEKVILGTIVRNPNRVRTFRNFWHDFNPNSVTGSLRFESSCPFNGLQQFQFSPDGQQAAAVARTSSQGQLVEAIQVFDWDGCESPPDPRDEIPGQRFSLRGFSGPDKPSVIQGFSWDGASLIALHGDVLNGLGDLVVYNLETRREQIIEPLPGLCCYGELQWSPDGQFLLFAFQDVSRANRTLLYYVPFGTIGTGMTYEPIPLPITFFQDPQAAISPSLRPAR